MIILLWGKIRSLFEIDSNPFRMLKVCVYFNGPGLGLYGPGLGLYGPGLGLYGPGMMTKVSWLV